MSQIILDNQLFDFAVWAQLQEWVAAKPLRALRPGEVIKDERVPVLLHTLNRPTFITIDQGFWHRRWRDANYRIVYFALEDKQQQHISTLLRRLFRLPEFRTRAARMGKVARVSEVNVQWWQLGDERLRRSVWLDS